MNIIIGIAAFAAIVAFWVISVTNRFKLMQVKITESESGIDVSLVKRYDTLTKLMDVVRAYAKHEVDVFSKVIQLRSGMSIAEKNEANQQMDECARGLIAVAENYPELRSAENYNQLQGAITDAEDHLQAARRVYNMNVTAYNQAIVVFPSSVIANKGNFTAREFFKADEIKRADVSINL
jgi:LemA protein